MFLCYDAMLFCCVVVWLGCFAVLFLVVLLLLLSLCFDVLLFVHLCVLLVYLYGYWLYWWFVVVLFYCLYVYLFSCLCVPLFFYVLMFVVVLCICFLPMFFCLLLCWVDDLLIVRVVRVAGFCCLCVEYICFVDLMICCMFVLFDLFVWLFGVMLCWLLYCCNVILFMHFLICWISDFFLYVCSVVWLSVS